MPAADVRPEPRPEQFPFDVAGLAKVGRGRKAYWKIGAYADADVPAGGQGGLAFDIGVRADKNPTTSCFLLLFVREEKETLGRILVE